MVRGPLHVSLHWPRAESGGGHSCPLLTDIRAQYTHAHSQQEAQVHEVELVTIRGSMDHIAFLGAQLHQQQLQQQQHAHVEPISFGIDQILSNVEQSCMLDTRTDPGYGPPPYIRNTGVGFTCGNGDCNNVGGNCVGADRNVGVGINGTNVNASGVISVPAHRPLSGTNSSLPLVRGGVNNLSELTFPWMESSRRFTKDRFTGDPILYYIIIYCII